MNKMKRVSVDSYQFRNGDVKSMAKLKNQSILQNFLELQKEFVSKKKKLQIAKQKKGTLLAEVRFLRRRHKHLLKIQSRSKLEPEQYIVQLQDSNIQVQVFTMDRSTNGAKEVVLKNQSPTLDLDPVLGGEENGGRKEEVVWEPLTVEKPPKNCLIDNKRVGKKKNIMARPGRFEEV